MTAGLLTGAALLIVRKVFFISILIPAAALITRSIGCCSISGLRLLYTRDFVQSQKRKSNGLKSGDRAGHDNPSCLASLISFSHTVHMDHLVFLVYCFSYTVGYTSTQLDKEYSFLL